MSVEFKLPELGENIEEGDVTSILVKVGDTVSVEQNIIEMETGKATVEIPIDVAGVITEIHVKEGVKAKVGQLIATVDPEEDASSDKEESKDESEEESKDESKEESKDEGKDESEEEAKDESKEEAEEPKEDKDTSKSEKTAAPSKPKKSTTAPARSVKAVSSQSEAMVPASPSTRKLAREIGVNINEVAGSGPGGRVVDNDVKAYSRDHRSAGGGGGGPIAAPLPDFGKFGDIEAEPLSNVRLATAQAMAVSWSNIPHVTIHDTVDITEIEKLRKANKAKAEKEGAKLTLTAFLIKILASALKVHPKFNTSIDLVDNQLIYKKYTNIGVAMDTDRGLVVPVMRGVDDLNVTEVAKELGEMGKRAAAGKIKLDDMQGGSITITNIGGIGGSFFTPIVNYPEVAILGVGRGSVQPVEVNGFFQPRLMLPLSLSFDHRVIDGADGARFLRWIADALQQPALLSLEG